MLIPLLFLCVFASGDTNSTTCEETLNRAISLNETYKNAISAGGQRVFGLEAERYFNTVLMKELSGCVTDASVSRNPASAKLVFELAYSYADTADDAIPRELARLYSLSPDMTKAILRDFEKNKRHILIEILQEGLRVLYEGKAEEKSRLNKLAQMLLALDGQ